MNKILFTCLIMVFAFQVQSQIFTSSKSKQNTISKMDAIEADYVRRKNKRNQTNKTVEVYNSSFSKEQAVKNYLSEKTGINVGFAKEKDVAAAHVELKENDAKYNALCRQASKEIKKKRAKFASIEPEYKLLLNSLDSNNEKVQKDKKGRVRKERVQKERKNRDRADRVERKERIKKD